MESNKHIMEKSLFDKMRILFNPYREVSNAQGMFC